MKNETKNENAFQKGSKTVQAEREQNAQQESSTYSSQGRIPPVRTLDQACEFDLWRLRKELGLI